MKRFVFSLFLIFIAGSAQAGGADSPLRFYDAQGHVIDAPGIATEIDVEIHGTIARAKVIQYFANDTDEWQEGKYTYPLPDDAAVDRLVMVIGDKRIAGFVAEKEKARQIYEQAKNRGQAASLVEQRRENLFHTSVANVPPRSLIAIEIGYQFDVQVDTEGFTLRLPTAVTPRYDRFSPEEFVMQASAGDGAAARELTERLALFEFGDGGNPFSFQARLDAGFETDSMESPSHKISYSRNRDGGATITLRDEIIIADKDIVLRWAPREKNVPLAFLHSEKLDSAYYSQLVIVPPEDDGADSRIIKQPRQVSMIIDVSGSMAGPSIRQAKAVLIEAIQDLEEKDYFNVIRFESQTQWLYEQSVPADAYHKKEAIKWVAGLEATGGTEMMPAIERALSEAPHAGALRQIVFITDGAIGYEGQLAAYIKDHVGDARFYAVGIGAAPNAHLMRLIAASGRGTFTFIGDVKETEEKMAALFAKMKSPVLTDLALILPDNITAETVPEKLPDLMRGEPVSVAIKSDAPLRDIVLSGRQDGKGRSYRVNAPDREAPGIGKIYARRKIAAFKYADPAGQSAQTEAQITALGIAHQIMSDYTSFVAVDDKIIRPEGEALVFKRYNPNLPQGWQLAEFDPREAAAAYDRYLQNFKENDKSPNGQKHDINLPQTATNWIMQIVFGLLSLLSGALVLRRGSRYVA